MFAAHDHKEMNNTERWNRRAQVAGLAKEATSHGTKEGKESQRPQSNEANEDQN